MEDKREFRKVERSEVADGPGGGQAGPAASPQILSPSIRHPLNTVEPPPRAGQGERTGSETRTLFPQSAHHEVLSLHGV